MKLETFFEKFDQFADAPDAVAKIRYNAGWIAPSGLRLIVDAIPRALPWAGMGRRVAAPGIRTHGAPQRTASSQRQRRAPSQPGATPQDHRPHSFPALKGRPNA